MSDTIQLPFSGSGLYAPANPTPAPQAPIPSRITTRPSNKFAGTCFSCDEQVSAEGGYRFRKDEGGWGVSHHDGECPKPVEAKVETKVGERGGRFEAPEVHPGIYTIENSTEPGRGHRTFRVELQAPDASFAPGETLLATLVGQDNETDYKAIAFISNGRPRFFKKFRDDPRNGVVIEDAKLLLADPEAALKAKHCLRCNAVLSVPTSIAAGFGPHCSKLGW